MLKGVINGQPWQIDMQKQQIIFGDDLYFSIQILGRFSYASETWLWSWTSVNTLFAC